MKENGNLKILIAGCLKMDPSKQLELYRHYYSYAMSICLRYAKTRESALEMVNDGFLKVFQKIHQYDSSQEFRPWLRRVLINAAIDHYRKYDKKEKLLEQKVSASVHSYNEVLDQIEFDDLIKTIKKLSPAYRMVFNLYVIEGYSHAQISEKLNISIGSSKSNLSKARQKIKVLLMEAHGINIKT